MQLANSKGLSALLPESAIRTGVQAADWRAAVQAAGDALAASGATEPGYTHEMITTVETLGPYIVIAPGIALAHARPSPLVHHTGFSWVRLAQPVPFGHPENDPVELVIGLAALDDNAHINGLAVLATLLDDDNRRSALMTATDACDLNQLICRLEQEMDLKT
jgi:PTS system ascorbate-specific IIA component